jgi:hypothetical protein
MQVGQTMRGLMLGFGLLGGSGLSGCSADVGEEAPEANLDNLTIRQYLVARGTNPDAIKIRGEEVWVDEDAYVEKAELLAEIEAAAFKVDPSQTPQGYYHNMQVSGRGGVSSIPVPPRAAKTYFRFDANVPEHWRQAFRTATAAWGNLSATDCLGFVEGTGPNGSSQITIVVGEAGTADDGNPASGDAKLPTFHSGGRLAPSYWIVGSRIRIDPSFKDVTDHNTQQSFALHELGHTLGFKHPWKGSWIGGTAKNGNSGCCSASYFTVMDYDGMSTLTADDRISALTTFKKKEIKNRIGQVTGHTCDY